MSYSHPTMNDSLESIIEKIEALCEAIKMNKGIVKIHFNSYLESGNNFRMGVGASNFWANTQPAFDITLYSVGAGGQLFDKEVDALLNQIIDELNSISIAFSKFNLSRSESSPINAGKDWEDDAKKLCIGFYHALIRPTPENCQYLLELSKTIAGHENVLKKVAMVFSIVAGLLLGLVPGLLFAAYHNRQKTWSKSDIHGLAKQAQDTHHLIENAISTKRFSQSFFKTTVDEKKTDSAFLEAMNSLTLS